MTFAANANSVYVDARDGGWRDEVAGHGRVLAARMPGLERSRHIGIERRRQGWLRWLRVMDVTDGVHGKEAKDRNVMLSPQLLGILRVYWRLARPRV